ncbi:hypothetical protein M0Q97_10680 [Candidatus Dojkabacteria bacterium]|jgi:hypothetical protein|nr:hypothetical protein [Candidatus Dojkabacteria bacterium]
MSLDRRIVSILYYNNIFDVNSVEEFIGEKNNFYEIKIDGKIMKLEIPNKGIEFNDVVESAKNNNLLSTKIDIINVCQLETLEQNLEKIEQLGKVEEKVEEKVEVEKVKVEKAKKPNPKISNKKIQIVDSKKVDNDFDDFDNFINII